MSEIYPGKHEEGTPLTPYEELDADRDRYRAALVKISGYTPIGRHASPDECAAIRELARQALEGDHG